MSNFPVVQANEQDPRKQNEIIRILSDGKSNNVDAVTLTANAATTVVVDVRATVGSYIEFMALTANAATEKAAGGMYVSVQDKQTFTITHANNAQTDRSFRYIIVG